MKGDDVMILADKIMELRKKNGWSQEELAEKIGVSRQSVSKWESAQAVPDLNKILVLSEVFGVTTDYLLKDEMVEEEYLEMQQDVSEEVRHITMEQANEFMGLKQMTAPRIATGVALCILSPIMLIVLTGAAEMGILPVTFTEDRASMIGLIVLILFVASAVFLFITSGAKTHDYEFLDTEIIETAYGVNGMVREKQKRYRNIYIRNCALGVCFCILSVVPLFMTIFVADNGFMVCIGVGLLLCMIAVGVYLLVKTGIIWESYEKLLQEGEYNKETKRNKKRNELISSVYWTVVIAVYLGYSFVTFSWNKSWIIWPVAAILYGALIAVMNFIRNKNEN